MVVECSLRRYQNMWERLLGWSIADPDSPRRTRTFPTSPLFRAECGRLLICQTVWAYVEIKLKLMNNDAEDWLLKLNVD